MPVLGTLYFRFFDVICMCQFSLNFKFQAVDNVAFLQLDTVWCYFVLKDMAKLTDAGKRLSEARKGFLRAHGPKLERIRILHGSFCPELAV